ncbi:MAG: hypothetical protein KGM47_14810 [Acidobacteriota bacterium]|nr:hypothetical protein [Acidobacteriota bacterium]
MAYILHPNGFPRIGRNEYLSLIEGESKQKIDPQAGFGKSAPPEVDSILGHDQALRRMSCETILPKAVSLTPYFWVPAFFLSRFF